LICRRGDSNPHELPHTPLKRARLPVPPLRLVSQGCQKADRSVGANTARVRPRHTGYFFVGAAVAAGDAAAEGDDCGVGAGVGVGCVVGPGTPDCKTEGVPVIIGSERISAISMNAAAAPIVIFESRVCVPRGPKAVLETELEKSAPASDLPGCSRIVTTRTMHARINSP
jgi:hypothetical protein